MDITPLEFHSISVKRALVRAGYTDTQRIREAPDEELLKIRGIGPMALKEIRSHPIILAEAGADQLLVAEMERVKLEADEKVRAAEERAEQKTEEARVRLEAAQELGRKAQTELARANHRAKDVSRLEPLLEGAVLIREYHQLRTKKWEWPSVRPHSITFSVGGAGGYWYVKAVPEGTESNKVQILQMVLDHPEYLLKLHEIATEAAGVTDRLEELSKQLSLLIEPIELFKIWAEEQEREATKEEVPQA